MKNRLRKFFVVFGEICTKSTLAVWAAFRFVGRWIKRGVKSLWFSAGCLLVYAVGMAVIAFQDGLTRYLALALIFMMSVFSTLFFLTTHDLKVVHKNFQTERLELHNLLTMREEELIKAQDTARKAITLSEGMETQLKHADRRYDELLSARTEDVIQEVHRRLKDEKPVRQAFPGVPAAPQAPPEVQAPF